MQGCSCYVKEQVQCHWNPVHSSTDFCKHLEGRYGAAYPQDNYYLVGMLPHKKKFKWNFTTTLYSLTSYILSVYKFNQYMHSQKFTGSGINIWSMTMLQPRKWIVDRLFNSHLRVITTYTFLNQPAPAMKFCCLFGSVFLLQGKPACYVCSVDCLLFYVFSKSVLKREQQL